MHDDCPPEASLAASSTGCAPSTANRLLFTGPALRRYFHSGWAFFIPYLLTYLLYAWRKWPANAVTGDPLPVTGDRALSTVHWLPIPPLLYVYWALHAIHVLLGIIALRSWMGDAKRAAKSEEVSAERPADSAVRGASIPVTLKRPAVNRIALRAIAPWALLALLFYIPGAFFEWPGDPWEHLRRINEWHLQASIASHTYWFKSSYFLAYSLVGWRHGIEQLFWLDYYYTGACLLLCWQYYRLARVIGLSQRASTCFVIIQTLMFGNNIFSFYRYYGISSTIFAQLGAVAVVRLLLDYIATTTRTARTGLCLYISIAQLLGALGLLFGVIAFNHVQGLGVAGLGIAAVVAWRLIAWKQSLVWWMIGGTILLNAVFVWLYPRADVLSLYRSEGYLGAWYGFDLLHPTSVSADRMLQVVGALGLLNFSVGLVLLRRNHVVGWLTLVPVFALIQPVVGILFCEKLSSIATGYVVSFNRMFLAVPPLLALAVITESIVAYVKNDSAIENSSRLAATIQRLIAPSALVFIAVLTSASPARPAYNRCWHAIEITPRDLCLRGVLVEYSMAATRTTREARPKFAPSRAGAAIAGSVFARGPAADPRNYGRPPIEEVLRTMESFRFDHTSLPRLRHNLSAKCALALSEAPDRARQPFPIVLFDSASTDAQAWCGLRKTQLQFGSDTAPLPKTAWLGNPLGTRTWAFTNTLFPVSESDTFHLEMAARQAIGHRAKVFLAVVWYDRTGTMLDSKVPAPKGAGDPTGWYNGLFSYFGLLGEPPPAVWTTYSVDFGLGEYFAVPPMARFMRVGALLNADGDSGGVAQIANVSLRRTFAPLPTVVPASAFTNYTATSAAAMLSHHWSSNQVAADFCGIKELGAAGDMLRRYNECTSRERRYFTGNRP